MVNSSHLILLFILLGGFCSSTAQDRGISPPSLMIEYRYSNGYYTNNEQLLTNSNYAIYSISKLNQPKEKHNLTREIIENSNDDTFVLPLDEIKLSAQSYFFNRDTRLAIYNTVDYDDNRFWVTDSLPETKWVIDQKNTKTFSGVECVRATITFRGRNYEAYFDPNIPSYFGPYKFRGLPGLIYSVRNLEDDITHSWTITNIDKYNKEINFETVYSSALKEKSISNKDLMEINEQLQNERNKASSSRLPKGVTLVKTEIVNLAIELEYD